MYMLLPYFLSIINNSNNKDLTYYVAKYIVENISHIDEVSLQDIADGCFVSVPTVKQFFKKFDYGNYLHFKEKLKVDLTVRLDQISRGYDSFNPLRLENAMKHISNGLQEFDETNLDSIVLEITRCKRVIIVGSPTITPILSNFQVDLITMGKTVIISSLINGNTFEFEEDDLILMISGTGRLFVSDTTLQEILNHYNNRVIIFSGDVNINFIYNVVNKVNIITENEMFETEYLLMYYFDMLRMKYYDSIKETIHGHKASI